MANEDIDTRLRYFETRIALLETEIAGLLRINQTEVIEASLNQIRRITEMMMRELCEKHDVSWAKNKEPTLENMRGPLRAHGVLGVRAHSQISTIQSYTSPASHAQKERFISSDLATVQTALVALLEWYFDEYGLGVTHGGAAAGTSSSAGDEPEFDDFFAEEPPDPSDRYRQVLEDAFERSGSVTLGMQDKIALTALRKELGLDMGVCRQLYEEVKQAWASPASRSSTELETAQIPRAASDPSARVTAALDELPGGLIVDSPQLRQVALAGTDGDEEAADLIEEAFNSVGREGVIVVEEGMRVDARVDVVEGARFDRGFLSPHFVTDHERSVCELTKPWILFVHGKLTDIGRAGQLLSKVAASYRPLLVVADDVEDQALGFLVDLCRRGALICCATKAAGFGDRRIATLEDLAVLTGGEALHAENGLLTATPELAALGTAARVTVTRDDTTIIDGGGAVQDLRRRVKQIEREIEDTTSDYDREKLMERLVRLVGGVAVIYVTALTDEDRAHRTATTRETVEALQLTLRG